MQLTLRRFRLKQDALVRGTVRRRAALPVQLAGPHTELQPGRAAGAIPVTDRSRVTAAMGQRGEAGTMARASQRVRSLSVEAPLPAQDAAEGSIERLCLERGLKMTGQRRIIAGHRTARVPANSQTPRNGPVPGRTGDVVALRPLAFYDAVGQRLAHKETAA